MKPRSTIFVLLLMVTIAACSPTGDLVREQVFIGETELSAIVTDPKSISLHITGDLPTACHAFNYEYEITIGRIGVTVYSTISPAATCIQGLHPFDEIIEIPMAGQADGSYLVYLNGELIGEINLVSE